MAKRSDFERIPRDAYDTPPEAVKALLAHLKPGTRFIEPCAGRGALEAAGHVCVGACDVEPRRGDIARLDANWLFTAQAAAYMPRVRKIIIIGRVKWIPGTTMTGKDDAIWIALDKPAQSPPLFFGRTP